MEEKTIGEIEWGIHGNLSVLFLQLPINLQLFLNKKVKKYFLDACREWNIVAWAKAETSEEAVSVVLMRGGQDCGGGNREREMDGQCM